MTSKNKGPCSMTAARYARVLSESGFGEAEVLAAKEVFEQCPELMCVLRNPVIERAVKHRIIDRAFSGKIRHFVKVVNDHGKIDRICEIFRSYEEQRDKAEGVVTAVLQYAVLPDRSRQLKMEAFICREFRAERVRWEMEECPDLIGGFLLNVAGREYDYSTKGRLKRLQQKLTWR